MKIEIETNTKHLTGSEQFEIDYSYRGRQTSGPWYQTLLGHIHDHFDYE